MPIKVLIKRPSQSKSNNINEIMVVHFINKEGILLDLKKLFKQFKSPRYYKHQEPRFVPLSNSVAPSNVVLPCRICHPYIHCGSSNTFHMDNGRTHDLLGSKNIAFTSTNENLLIKNGSFTCLLTL